MAMMRGLATRDSLNSVALKTGLLALLKSRKVDDKWGFFCYVHRRCQQRAGFIQPSSCVRANFATGGALTSRTHRDRRWRSLRLPHHEDGSISRHLKPPL